MKRSRICLALVLALLLCGCSLFQTYEDTNGPTDRSLQTLTVDDMVHSTSHLAKGATKSLKNGQYDYSFQSLNGVTELMVLQPGDRITLSCSVTRGNARLALCSEDELVYDFALDAESQQFIFSQTEGRLSLRLAGEDCSAVLHFTVD